MNKNYHTSYSNCHHLPHPDYCPIEKFETIKIVLSFPTFSEISVGIQFTSNHHFLQIQRDINPEPTATQKANIADMLPLDKLLFFTHSHSIMIKNSKIMSLLYYHN